MKNRKYQVLKRRFFLGMQLHCLNYNHKVIDNNHLQSDW